MLKVFSEHLKTELARRVIEADSGFALSKKKLGTAYSNSLILERRTCAPFVGFIHLQFVRGRNYVIPSVQWSCTGNYPNEAECREIQDEMFSKGMTCERMRDELPEGWLRTTDFGAKFSHFEIDDERPPRHVIRPAYATPKAQAVLRSDPFLSDGNWEGHPDYDNWDVMVAMTGVTPTTEDASQAMKDLLDKVATVALTIYVPFLLQAEACVSRSTGPAA